MIEISNSPSHGKDVPNNLDPDALEAMQKHQDELLRMIGPYVGKQNLDIGCGTGIPSLIQQKRLGTSPTLCDVVDIRVPEARSLPFRKIKGEQLPFSDKEFESSGIQYVLHHISTRDAAIATLSEAFRVSKRVILIEEIQGKLTNVEFAKRVDREVNELMHPSQPMPVREYFTENQVYKVIESLGHKVIFHRKFSNGLRLNGYLEKHVFVAE